MLLLLVFIVGLGFLVVKSWQFRRTVGKIPSPRGLPIVGNLLAFLARPDLLLVKVRGFAVRYYPIYRLSSFYFSIVALLEPKDIEMVLSSTKHMSKSRIYDYLHSWLGTGLLTSTGEKWQKRRKILTPAFHFDILQQFVPAFNDETEKLVDVFENKMGKAPFDVVPLVTNFTLRSIGETAMGLKNVEQDNYLQYKKAVYRIGQIVLQRISKPLLHLQALYNYSSLGCEEKTVVKILRDFSNDIILAKEKNLVEKSGKRRLAMLDLLLTARRDGADIDHDGIHEEVDTFMFEGHDTTAMAISFILLTLSNQPQAQTQIFEEILTTIGPTKLPTLQDLQSLKYTERCIKECLRLFPSVPFITRRAGEDFTTTTGYRIPKKTILHIHIFDVHRNSILYPDPLKFDPDRFLPENASKRHPFAYIPFSAGPRNCIGQRFALLELKAVLCGILRRFVLEKEDDMYGVEFIPDLVLRPKKGIRIRVRPRLIDAE